MLQETQDREEIIERVSALDIGKAKPACVRVPTAGCREREPGDRQAVTWPRLCGGDGGRGGLRLAGLSWLASMHPRFRS